MSVPRGVTPAGAGVAGLAREGSTIPGVLASDRDRDRTAAALREHYTRGRLSLEELSSRTELALAARSRADLRRAVVGLPLVADVQELVQQGRSVARSVVRGLVLAAMTAAYLLFTLVLVVVVPLVLLIHGATGGELLALLVVWLVPTYLLSRLWRRGLRRSTP